MYDLVEQREELFAALGVLSVRERQIVRLRFVDERTQTEIGYIVGISQMQVSRLLNSIITRLRTTLASAEEPGSAFLDRKSAAQPMSPHALSV